MFWKKYALISLAEPHYNFVLNTGIIMLYRKSPEYFYDNIRISAVHGCFPFSIWSYDRENKFLSDSYISKILTFYSKCNISVNLVFDNEFITRSDLSDTYSNLLLKSTHNNNNIITLKSPVLEAYIKENYPLFKIKRIVEFDSNNMFNEQNISLDSKFNNTDKLKYFKYKENADITLNPVCPSNCKYYELHKKYLMKEQKGFYSTSAFFVCPLNKDYNFYSLFKNDNFIDRKKMDKYLKSGFKNFKIDYPSVLKNTSVQYSFYDFIESCLYYLIKPKYQNEIRKKLISLTYKVKERKSEIKI